MPFLNRSQKSKDAEAFIDKRRGKSATYTQPLIGSSVEEQEDIMSFLSEFYLTTIFDQSGCMKRLLKQYPDTIGTHYSLLVPDVVSFDQFWARYFYRCSVTTVLAEWERAQHDQENVRKALSKSVSGMQSQFLKLEIERGLGSRIAIMSSENSPATTRTPAIVSPAEQRAAMRAAILKEEVDIDITETIDEEEEEEEGAAIGIGFASSG